MRVYTEKTESFRICGIKAGLGEKQRREIISDFLGNDEGARFESLLGCGPGFFGVIRREEKRSFLCEKTYLYGKSIYPTVYIPAGGAQWALPAATYLKAEFTEDEKRALTVEGAWRFLEEIYLPSCSYVRDETNPYAVEYYDHADSDRCLQIWIPVTGLQL